MEVGEESMSDKLITVEADAEDDDANEEVVEEENDEDSLLELLSPGNIKGRRASHPCFQSKPSSLSLEMI